MEKLFFADETMVVIGNDQLFDIWKKSDEKYAPNFVCHEENKRIIVMFWGCVTSKGFGALAPTSETTDTRKYIEILEKYFRPSVSWYFRDDAITIQHDNTPCHVPRLIRKYLEEHDICTMEWSA